MTHFNITVRRSIELVGLFFLGYILYIGKGIITPILLAFFTCLVLLPIFQFLRRKRVPEILAIIICIVFLFMMMGGLIWFFTAQISSLARDFPTLQTNVMHYLNELSEWINEKTDFSSEKQLEMVNNQSNMLLSYAGGLLGTTASSISSVVVLLGLLPLYVFLILFYRNLILQFLYMWVPKTAHDNLDKTITEIQVIMKSYLLGLFIELIYMTVLVGLILLLFGIKHALLIGVIVAILNLIPYVGPFISNIIAIMLTLTSGSSFIAVIEVVAVIYVVQLIDNNILMPRIVGGKIKINALATIIGILLGGAIMGAWGMFLSLPIIAVLKIIFNNSTNFKHWGILLGDTRPEHRPVRE
ncbi:putative PurR-regulated permease PerM [Chitinophaga skermanii]|uniref:Putative PurR-regulated permease PerM n=1 Tax=Chitinophaga skermanii TaxID=331697 RepID=A0A327Q6T3_9BACT|nr:AI-2E family transporter [Chitinophaga skermanii]RAI97556.1 putative PurR-regulated permease PerM [Chitinophaga skermanii]